MPSSTSRRSVRAALVALIGVVVLAVGAACTTTVVGQASYANGIKKTAPQSNLEIKGSDGGKIDKLVANSLSDIFAYWKGKFEKDFGKKWKPISGGIYSYTPDQSEKIPCIGSAKSGADNAYYCPSGDLIAYDRDFLKKLADQYGDFIVPLILAHEYGHAIQDEIGDTGNKSIVVETQADCYAGVFVNAATKGTPHFSVTTKDLDSVLAGYLLFRDEPGGSASQAGSHGSGFDRVSAFQEGYVDGTQACLKNFNDKRTFTETPYTSPNDAANKGNAPYSSIGGIGTDEFNLYFDEVLSKKNKKWNEIKSKQFDGNSASCDGKKQKQLIFLCTSDDTVYYAGTDLAKKAYENFGDYAVVQLMGIEYADAALNVLGNKAKGKDRLTKQICLTGTYAGDAFRRTAEGQATLAGNTLSAGDLDEAVAVLLGIGSSNVVLDTHEMTAFDRINAFRKGVLSSINTGPDIDSCLK
ncbi:putative metalloprotease [Antricoccus suffuscus]|uniref:Putative metalloprotease n=1 Tax=Antricoccus suffuscus TaxID=1629062 RepID=A0A2T1A4A7_9ACTN|nr:neutral zinc metallopeptidase [Antricoccus suffuscus]PRZ43433.1 putative metalloprotease [Antricoccus suffuscus]